MKFTTLSKLIFLLVTSLIGSVCSQEQCIGRLQDVPACNLVVKYTDDSSLKCNELVTQTVMSVAPAVYLEDEEEDDGDDGDEDDEYLLLMVDPDAPHPCPPPSAYYLHWMALVSLEPNSRLSVSQTYVEYRPPTPPPGDAHRYQLFLFPLSGGVLQETIPQSRSSFKMEDFMQRNGLTNDAVVASFQFKYKS